MLYLSIPAWFDWRYRIRSRLRRKRSAFNPSLVRLAPEPAYGIKKDGKPFNPSLVRLALILA